MTNPFREIDKQLRKNKAVNDQLQIQEFSKVVALKSTVRVLDDSTARNVTFTANVQVTGVGGLPARITGVWYFCFVSSGSAANALGIAITDPDGGGPFNVVAKLANIGDQISASGFVRLGDSAGSNAGKLTYTVQQGTNPVLGRIVIDIAGYLV